MKIRSSIAFVFIFAMLASSPGLAQQDSPPTQDDIRKRGDIACGADSRKMCSKFFGDDMQVLACLQNNKVRLAGSCRKFLTEIGQLHGLAAGGGQGKVRCFVTHFQVRLGRVELSD